MQVHLVDGTFELFRHHFGRPSRTTADGTEVAATTGVLSSILDMLEGGVTHLGVATDHVVESFRNQMWPGYKTGQGVAPELLAQFGLLEEALAAMGVVVWAMVDLEADDALASAAAAAAGDGRVEQVLICTPDKDLAQCVVGNRVVLLDRRRRKVQGDGGAEVAADPRGVITDEAGVWARYGVAPESIPDWLALVGDSSDGFPGLAGWGPRSASLVLARYRHLESVPASPGQWEVTVRGGAKLAGELVGRWEEALLFRELATLRVDPSLLDSVDRLAWRGPAPSFPGLCRRLGMPALATRASGLAGGRSGVSGTTPRPDR